MFNAMKCPQNKQVPGMIYGTAFSNRSFSLPEKPGNVNSHTEDFQKLENVLSFTKLGHWKLPPQISLKKASPYQK